MTADDLRAALLALPTDGDWTTPLTETAAVMRERQREAAAVEAALDATLCAHCAGDEQSYESFKAKGRAAYLTARRGA